jgi:hypothetical protein
MPEPPVQRVRSIEDCRAILAIIASGDLSMEEGFRLLYPEEAEVICSPGRWPVGVPDSWRTRHSL